MGNSYNDINLQKLFEDARSVFSDGMVDSLISKGLDIIEGESQGIYISDVNSAKYIDCYSGSSTYNLGRNNKQVSQALKDAVLNTDCGNFVLVSEEKADLASRLVEFVGGDLDCVYFSVVRGEAMDAACKLARGFTKKTELITVDGGCYGDTGFAMSLSDVDSNNLYGRLIPDQTIVPFNDVKAVEKAISSMTAAFIIEPMQVENGCRMADKAYLRKVRELCDFHGALLVFDETQTGFGRTGYKFITDYYGVNPDIMLFGEAVTAGQFPMTGLMFTQEVKAFFDQHPLIHLCTFGGHDIGCRVAVKAIELYKSTQPWIEANRNGFLFDIFLKKMKEKYSKFIENTGGIGLINSIDFNNEDIANLFCTTARKNGFIVLQGELKERSVVFRPPLTITEDELNDLMGLVENVLENMNVATKTVG